MKPISWRRRCATHSAWATGPAISPAPARPASRPARWAMRSSVGSRRLSSRALWIPRALEALGDLAEDRRVVDRRRHAIVLAVGDRPHRAAQDLARPCLRQALDDERRLEAGDRA